MQTALRWRSDPFDASQQYNGVVARGQQVANYLNMAEAISNRG